jgi:hypothetical protein
MKTIEIPEIVYADLATISKELSKVAKKPISMPMALYLLISVYRAHMSEPCARDAFNQKLANTPMMSPEEFQETSDVPMG